MGVGVAGLAFMLYVLVAVGATTDADTGDLWLPAAALGSFWALWIVIHALVAAVHGLRERRAIARLMSAEHCTC
jgi:hypothetical protein